MSLIQLTIESDIQTAYQKTVVLTFYQLYLGKNVDINNRLTNEIPLSIQEELPILIF